MAFSENTLYKYSTINHHLINNLKNGTLHFKCHVKYNDPFDCRLKIRVDGTQEEWESYRRINDLNEEQLARIKKKNTITEENSGLHYKQLHKKALKNARISCFSTVFNNILMWSHYADSHKGICLIFESSPVPNEPNVKSLRFHKEDINNLTNPLDDNVLPILKVNYKAELPGTYNFLELNSADIEPFLITKAPDWQYESEWRILAPDDYLLRGDNPRYETEQLKGLIFGMNCSKANIGKIKQIFRGQLEMTFYQTFAIKDVYSLGIKQI